MIRHPLFLSAFLLLVVIGVLEQAGVAYSLFDRYPWYDVLLHYLGGAWVALIAAWSYDRFPAVRRLFPHAGSAVFTVAVVLLVGSLWEWYERLLGLHLFVPDYTRDVIEDLIMDTLGALTVVLYAARLRNKRRV